MRNAIYNYYNIVVDDINKDNNNYFFYYNDKLFLLYLVLNDTNMVEEIYKYVINNNIECFKIVLNKNIYYKTVAHYTQSVFAFDMTIVFTINNGYYYLFEYFDYYYYYYSIHQF